LSYYKEAYKIINIVLGKLSLNIENKKNLQIDNLNFVNNDIDNIKFSDVSFHYLSRSENKVINNLSLEFHKGEIVGIFGKSGRGKSTILDLLMGLINPINGKILYNNQDIKENSINLSKIVGYVSQNVYLFDDTLKKNITFLDNDIEDKKRLLSAISHAQLNDFIEKMPSKILTNVGNMGSNLSGGQIQRIGIARALYKNPEIIIFDEATNSLDKESEKQILSKFKDPVFSKKIIFLVSHDPKIISYCNRAIIIKKDLVTEDLNLNQIKNLSEQKIIEIL
jgi:ATP-binding cassette subfamily C protein